MYYLFNQLKLMIVKRDKFFSEEEDKKKDNKKDLKSVGVGLGVGVGAWKGLKKLNKSHGKYVMFEDKKLSKENEKLLEKLEKVGEEQGTAVYTGTRETMRSGGFYNKGKLRGPYSYLDKEGCKPGKAGDLIVTSENADVLAHELGHSKYSKKGRAKGVGGAVGRIAHKTDRLGRSYMGRPGLVNGFLTGMAAGSIEEARKNRGKKENKIIRHSSWGIPVAAAIPTLVAEGMASRKGLKILKQSGASKEYLKKSRKNLARAWGTYATSTAASAGSGEVGRVAGKRLIKGVHKLEQKEEDKKLNQNKIKK